jgi:DNA-binding MarR family transcriptional regulator
MRIVNESSTIADEVMEQLMPVMAGERAAFAHRCHDRQISMAHLFLMSMIEKNGPLPMTRVAEVIGSGLPTATGIISRMEERGLVRREHDTHDRRVVLANLTDAGLAELEELHALRRQRMASAINKLTDAERAKLLSSLQSLRAAFERVEREGATS